MIVFFIQYHVYTLNLNTHTSFFDKMKSCISRQPGSPFDQCCRSMNCKKYWCLICQYILWSRNRILRWFAAVFPPPTFSVLYFLGNKGFAIPCKGIMRTKNALDIMFWILYSWDGFICIIMGFVYNFIFVDLHNLYYYF